jgi:hypothetical protein
MFRQGQKLLEIRRRFFASKRKSNMRIFLGTVEVAGYYTNLAKGLRALGISCVKVELAPHQFEYGDPDKTLPFVVRWVRELASSRAKGAFSPHSLKNILCSIAEQFLRFVVLLWAIPSFDVFILAFSSNIVGARLGYWDLRLLKRLGKCVICVGHGSASRPAYLDGAIVNHLEARELLLKVSERARKQKEVVAQIEQMANVVIDSPACGHFYAKPYVNWFSIGVPSAEISSSARESPHNPESIRILHSPSDRISKGSDQIQAAISRLQSKGHKLVFVEINNKPHRQVLDEIRNSNFVIDQLYSDTPMASFAAEAASFGIPVVVGGYLEQYAEFSALLKQTPSYYCAPNELEHAVEKMIVDAELRSDLGKRARKFIAEQWSSSTVAKRFLRVIGGDIPADWWCDPKAVSYVHGYGLEEADLKRMIKSLIGRHGLSALQLDDKPPLRNRLLKLAECG